MTAIWHAILDPNERFSQVVSYKPSFVGFDAAVLEILVEFGADINVFGDYDSPLHCVLRACGETTSAELPCALMYYGADPTNTLDDRIPILADLGVC